MKVALFVHIAVYGKKRKQFVRNTIFLFAIYCDEDVKMMSYKR